MVAVIPAVVAVEQYQRVMVRLQAVAVDSAAAVVDSAAAVADSAAAVAVVDLLRPMEHPVEEAVAADTPVGHRPPATEHPRLQATEHPRLQAMEHRPTAVVVVSEVVASVVERLPAAMEHLVLVEALAAGHRPPVMELHLVPLAATGHHP